MIDNKEPISFWKLISDTEFSKICIPTIQRDYAQGRMGKEYLRSQFLYSLKNALIGQESIRLDFIYGIEDDAMFVPLDGQQRLTTLWLLHWYIAFKSGVLHRDKQIRDILMKFTYETRLSSTDFCKSLCHLNPIEYKGQKMVDNTIRTWVMKQTWFYNHYKQDPTIMGMLNMISGTNTTNNILDCLEKVFNDDNCDYQEIWSKLVKKNCISFYKLQVDLSDADELYIKMNSRGKHLSNFENFKTEFIKHIENILGVEKALIFAAKIDVEWTDIFWNNRWENHNTGDISIDKIYFEFIRRFVIVEAKSKDIDDFVVDKDFYSFEPYKNVFDERSIEDFILIMDRIRGLQLSTTSSWGESFDFIPKYNIDESVDELSNKNKLLFYAYCRYFVENKYDENSFQEWNRVVWNISENIVDGNIDKTFKLIYELSSYSHNIIKYLSQNEDIDFSINKEQMLEEQRKARMFEVYGKEILEMESYAFFKGAIRFLFTDANGNEDWDSFKIKKDNVRYLIPEERKERHTIKELTSYLGEDEIINLYSNWVSNNDLDLRKILLDSKGKRGLHNFFLQNRICYDSLLHRDIIVLSEYAFDGRAYLQTKWKNHSKWIWTNYSKASGYYIYNSYIINNEEHSKVLKIIEDSQYFIININETQRIYSLIKGLQFNFIYKEHYFTLYGNNTICMMTNNWINKYQNTNNDNGYYFCIHGIYTEEKLKEQIDLLISEID